MQLFFTLHSKCPFCRDKDTTVFIVSLYPKGKTWWFFLYLSPEKDEESKREREKPCLQFDIIHPIKRTEIICHSSPADRILWRASGLPDFLTVKLQSGSIVPRLRKEKDLITPSGQERKFHLLESTFSAQVQRTCVRLAGSCICYACFSRTKPTALKRLKLYLFPANWGILNCRFCAWQGCKVFPDFVWNIIFTNISSNGAWNALHTSICKCNSSMNTHYVLEWSVKF